MIEICFVCTGNTCRSVMAERIAKKKAKLRHIKNVKFSSCGILAKKENITENAKNALKELGYDGRDRKSVKLKVKPNVLYVTMTDSQKQSINSKKCISCSSLFKEVPDPYGQNQDIYRITALIIEKNIDILLDKLENLRGEVWLLWQVTTEVTNLKNS